MIFKKENPTKQSGGGMKKVENPVKKSSKGKGSEFTGPHSDVSYKDENPYVNSGKKSKKTGGGKSFKRKGMKKMESDGGY